MDWTQLATLAGYTTAVCFFFYKLNEKTIKEWREEHKQQIQETNDRFEKGLQESNAHWREMFMYMSTRIDNKN